ncbi:MAG: O-antigen ligase family protein, partial [Verrucomicrobiales bacterium]
MPVGHGPIDYVVVIICLLIAGHALLTDPRRLLYFLPAFVTIDFFIPLVSQLTPGRLIPLMIGCWWLATNGLPRGLPLSRWLAIGSVVIVAAALFGYLSGGSGSRAVIRSLNYVNLLILCGFTWKHARTRTGIRMLLSGFAIAGLIHGFHSIYQVFANKFELPYRSIVYSEDESPMRIQMLTAGFRINGFADEPKRLGFVLLTGSLALVHLASAVRESPRRYTMQIIASVLFLLSLYTFSSSFLFALAIWLPIMLLISRRSWKFFAGAIIASALVFVLKVDLILNYIDIQKEFIESREQEMEEGLDATKVYRQEFYANDYLKRHPLKIVTGVGMGQYYMAFRKFYGPVAGMGVGGALLPLNSQIFEVILDTGIAGALLIYLGGIIVIWKLKRLGPDGAIMSIISAFILIQSLFVQSLSYHALTMGAGAAMLWAAIRPPRRRSTGRMWPPPTNDDESDDESNDESDDESDDEFDDEFDDES